MSNPVVTRIRQRYKPAAILFAVLFGIPLALTVIFFLCFHNSNPSSGLMLCVIFVGVNLMATVAYSGLWRSYKTKVKIVTQETPQTCVLEDVIITRRLKDNGGYCYYASPVLKDDMGRLYCLFMQSNKSFYTAQFVRKEDGTDDILITRSNGTQVAIGDKVALYLTETERLNVEVDEDGTTYRINNRPYEFQNHNENHDISILNQICFVNGLIDVD